MKKLLRRIAFAPLPFPPGRGFRADERGNTAMLFAVALLPLLGMCGSAVDYANALRFKAGLQIALDAGVIAGAADLLQGGTKAHAEGVVASYVSAKFTSPGASSPSVTATGDPSGKMTATAQINVPTNFMRVFGTNNMAMSVTSEAMFGLTNAEVVIALDTTGSMAGAKLAAAQAAANNLIDTLYAAPGSAAKVKVGLVPFNYYANVGTAYRGAPWLSSSSDYSTPYPADCNDTYPSAVYGAPVTATGYNDGVPYTYTDTPVISYGEPVSACYPSGMTPHVWGGAVGSRNYPADLQDALSAGNPAPAIFDVGDLPGPLMRLTNDKAAVKTQINALLPAGETYIPSGLLWGWRVLSPNLPFADGSAYGASRKILILMTDGANTVSPTYPAHDGSDSAIANSLTSQTCAAMKAAPAGISVYTIAFQVSDPTIQGVLSGCASAPANFFNSATIADMQAAFTKIGADLTGVRVSQ